MFPTWLYTPDFCWLNKHQWLHVPMVYVSLYPIASNCIPIIPMKCKCIHMISNYNILEFCNGLHINYIYTSIHTHIYIHTYICIHIYIYIYYDVIHIYMYNIVRFHIDYISHLKTMALPRLRQGDAAMSCGCHEAHVASAGSQLQDTVTAGKPGFPMLGGWFPC